MSSLDAVFSHAWWCFPFLIWKKYIYLMLR
jgi:hypothetical protein